MANISLYISGQTELEDVTEFFQKRMTGEGETPIAFFDGVFYESHQERVGNIVYQDYLVYTDKALYLWARGASKDYLDRFSLGAVSVNSRNKDSAFATMNLKIRREGKEPIFVIFDMVEIREAEKIVKLQTLVESIIEDYLGINYRQEIPQDTANRIIQAARTVCPPSQLSLIPDTPTAPVPDAGIGYGQDLLEQYRASMGQGQEQAPYPPYQPPGTGGSRPRGGMGPQDAMRGLEAMLPTDPASLKRIAEQIKNMVGDAPFKMRDQVMKDLQHVPGDMATVLTALNELLSNIAGNPMAERFVMNAIKTAVVNDGVLGSLGKIVKMTGFGSGGGKKSQKSPAHEPSREERSAPKGRKSPFVEEQDDDSSTIRRKKISIKDDDDHDGDDLFAGNDEPITSRESRLPDSGDAGAGSGARRKKLSIKMEDDNEIARKLMSYDESERDDAPAPQAEASVVAPPVGSNENGSGIRRKKLSIKAEEDSGAKADIAQKLMSYDEEQRGAINSGKGQGSAAVEAQPEPEAPVRKKIKIKAESDSEPEVSPGFEIELDPEVLSALELEAESEPEAPVKKKIQIKAVSDPEEVVLPEPGVELEPEVMSALESETESEPESPVKKKIQIKAEVEPEPEVSSEPELESVIESAVEEPVRKKIQIKADVEPELEISPEQEIDALIEPDHETTVQKDIRIEAELEEQIDISEEVILSALGEPEAQGSSNESNEYMTIESDVPVQRSEMEDNETKEVKEPVIEKTAEPQRHSSGKSGRGKRRGRKV